VHHAAPSSGSISGSCLFLISCPADDERCPLRASSRQTRHRKSDRITKETGLSCFQINALLGEQFYDMRPFGKEEVHHRYFYHAILTGEAPERWRHCEGNAGPDLIPLEFF
jgi:hypothetical protein